MALLPFFGRRGAQPQSGGSAAYGGTTRSGLARIEPQAISAPVRRDAGSAGDGSTDFALGWPSPQLVGLFGGTVGSTGIPVSSNGAMQIAAAYGCVRAFSRDVGKLPLQLKRRLPEGGLQVDTKHRLNKLLRKPNSWQTPFEFWAYMASCYLLRGNSYAVIVRGMYGDPIGLVPVNPDRVSVMLSPRGWLFYNLSHPALGDGLMLHQGDMVHIRGLSIDGGYIGITPVAAAPDVFGIGIAAQQHGAVLFRNGAQIAGVLMSPKTLSKESAQRMAQSWRDVYGGVQNSHKVAVLEEGTKFEKVAMTSEDAQLLESRQYTVLEVCRMYGVPPHKVYDLSDAHYSNIENVNQAYIDDSLAPFWTQVEQRLGMNLLFQQEQEEYVFAVDFRALLRGDRKSRYDAYGQGLDRGFLCINEVRAEEGMNPVPGGDQFRVRLDTDKLPDSSGAASPAAGSSGGSPLDPAVGAASEDEERAEDADLEPTPDGE